MTYENDDLFQGKFPVLLTFNVDGETSIFPSNYKPKSSLAVQNSKEPGFKSLNTYQYGIKAGIPRILELLDRYNIKATFFISAYMIENYKPQIEKIVEHGHEIGHRAWINEYPDQIGNIEQEREFLEKSIHTIKSLTGAAPVGFRSPGDYSANTLNLLKEKAFVYLSNKLDDDTPYLYHFDDKKPLVEIPIHHQFNDYNFSGFNYAMPGPQIYSYSNTLKLWKEEFDALSSEHNRMITVSCDPRYSGTCGGIELLDRFIKHCFTYHRTWFARCDEVAKTFLLNYK